MFQENSKQRRLVVVGFLLIVPIVVVLYLWRWNREQNEVTRAMTLAWYTDDDGKSWYSDEKSLMPPFDHDGKTSVRAIVFTCDGDKHEFVGYLERYTPQAKQAIEQSRAQVVADKSPPPVGLYETIAKTGTEVKRPGDTNWINVDSPQAVTIRKVACPAGGTLQEVNP